MERAAGEKNGAYTVVGGGGGLDQNKEERREKELAGKRILAARQGREMYCFVERVMHCTPEDRSPSSPPPVLIPPHERGNKKSLQRGLLIALLMEDEDMRIDRAHITSGEEDDSSSYLMDGWMVPAWVTMLSTAPRMAQKALDDGHAMALVIWNI